MLSNILVVNVGSESGILRLKSTVGISYESLINQQILLTMSWLYYVLHFNSFWYAIILVLVNLTFKNKSNMKQDKIIIYYLQIDEYSFESLKVSFRYFNVTCLCQYTIFIYFYTTLFYLHDMHPMGTIVSIFIAAGSPTTTLIDIL